LRRSNSPLFIVNRLGKARHGGARRGKARQGKARQGYHLSLSFLMNDALMVWRGVPRLGAARRGKARQGKARQGKGVFLFSKNRK